MDPAARASTSSASGLYQFIESTWLDTVKRHGARFGLGDVADQIKPGAGGAHYVADPAQKSAILALRNNPEIASLMAAGLAEDNRAHLSGVLGRQPENGELYLAHFLGAGGAGRFLSAMEDNPAQSAAALFRRPAAANRSVFYEGNGEARSLAGVMGYLNAKLDSALEKAGSFPERNQRFAGGVPQPVPYLIADENVFGPGSPATITMNARHTLGSAPAIRSVGEQPLRTPPPVTPTAPAHQTGGSRAPAMSSLLQSTFEASGASQLASPASAARIKDAYARLRSLGL